MERATVFSGTGKAPSLHRNTPYQHDLTALPRQGVVIIGQTFQSEQRLAGSIRLYPKDKERPSSEQSQPVSK